MPMGSHMHYPQQSTEYSTLMGQVHRSLPPNPAARATGSHYYGPYGYNAALPVNYSMPMGETVRSPSPAAPAMGGSPNHPHGFAAGLMTKYRDMPLSQIDHSSLANPASRTYYDLHGYAAAALPASYPMPMGQTNSSVLYNPATLATGGDPYGAHGYSATPLEMNHSMPVGSSTLSNHAAPAMGGTDYDPLGYAPAELATNEPAIPPADSFDDDYPWFAALVGQQNDRAGGAL